MCTITPLCPFIYSLVFSHRMRSWGMDSPPGDNCRNSALALGQSLEALKVEQWLRTRCPWLLQHLTEAARYHLGGNHAGSPFYLPPPWPSLSHGDQAVLPLSKKDQNFSWAQNREGTLGPQSCCSESSGRPASAPLGNLASTNSRCHQLRCSGTWETQQATCQKTFALTQGRHCLWKTQIPDTCLLLTSGFSRLLSPMVPLCCEKKLLLAACSWNCSLLSLKLQTLFKVPYVNNIVQCRIGQN